ncbi:MAG: SRPBCC family protein [Prochlorotrichaceae cyanobacterium]
MPAQVFEQRIQIQAPAQVVEQCLTERSLMHQWLNPALRCDPVGEWSVALGAKSRFILNIPIWEPALENEVVERRPGLIVWQFRGFFTGTDRWECLPQGEDKTELLNRFEFQIPNPLVNVGFQVFAAHWTQRDMQAQLKRIQQLAETLSP